MNIVKADKSKLNKTFSLDLSNHYTITNCTSIIRILIILTLLLIYSISCIAVKPLYHSNHISSCEYSDENYVNSSDIDKTIKKYNPEISKTIYLIPNYGSPIKTLKVYKYRNNNQIERILLFHITDMFTFELKLDSLIIEGNKIDIKKKIYDDASVIIGNAQDFLFYITLYEKEYNEIINSEDLIFKINDMELKLYPACKNSVLF